MTAENKPSKEVIDKWNNEKNSDCHICNGHMQMIDWNKVYCSSCKIYQYITGDWGKPELCLDFQETRFPLLMHCVICERDTIDKDGKRYCPSCNLFYGYVSFNPGVHDS